MTKKRRRRRVSCMFIVIVLLLLFSIWASSCSRQDSLGELLRTGRPSIGNYDYAALTQTRQKRIGQYCAMSDDEWKVYYNEQTKAANELSERLEKYILSWHDQQADPKLPAGLLPASIDNEKTTDWTLVDPDTIEAEEQWYARLANEIPEDFSSLYFLSPDNHVTYLRLIFVAPLGSQLLIEGDFPHARFMDYQILGPYDPEHPSTGGMGAPEVPIVDVDINPDPGHTNPFRPGADRNATQRHYHLTFELTAGNAAELNPEAMSPPAYRAPGNTRVGAPFSAAGPVGDSAIVASVVWLRYYAPDHDKGPYGGVPLPKARLRLKTGEEFWLKTNFEVTEKLQNLAVSGFETPPREPPKILGPSLGWLKMFGIWLTLADGMAAPLVRPNGPLPKSWAERLLTEADNCMFGRGPNRPSPGNLEPSATLLNYNTYLVRPISLGANKVYALTGKLPQTPKTRNGEAVAQTAEARYWSMCRTGSGEGRKYPGLLYGCLMDDEILTNEESNYLMVFSRSQKRPANARPECGVTWQAFGPESTQILNLRWMSVIPDDHLPAIAPHQDNIGWEKGEWSQPTWDRSIMSNNNQEGFMGVYQPLLHYLSVEEFEQLGCPIAPQAVPLWQ